MQKAELIIRDHCDENEIIIDPEIDPNHTGLIGPRLSGITTTLGNPEAKRTTTTPDMAALVVRLLHTAGVGRGDTIAIGCSGSFPALMIGSLCAAAAMDVFPVTIISIGSSSYGATRIDFNLLDIYNLLLDNKIIDLKPAAVSLGGMKDVGGDFDPSLRRMLIKKIQASGIPFIYEDDLQSNVAKRMEIYQGSSKRNRIAAFINCGGSYANIGSSESILRLKPGINRKISIPPQQKRGVLFEMASKKIPCIHLLFIKGLAHKYNLPWDPIPLPQPGSIDIYREKGGINWKIITVAVGYLTLLTIIFLYDISKDR